MYQQCFAWFYQKRLLCWTPPADQCNAQTTSLPWHVVDDRVVLCHADATDKTLTTLANLVCDVTKTRGVTEIRMIDHSMQPKMKAWGFPNSKFDQKNPKNLTHQICWITFISCIRWGPDGSQLPLAYRLQGDPRCQGELLPTQRHHGWQNDPSSRPIWCYLERPHDPVAKGKSLWCGLGGLGAVKIKQNLPICTTLFDRWSSCNIIDHGCCRFDCFTSCHDIIIC